MHKKKLRDFQRKEFMQVETQDGKNKYWTLKDQWFLPYLHIDEELIKDLPTPFYLYNIDPGCELGFDTEETDELTNVIELNPEYLLTLSKNMRDNIRNLRSKNKDLALIRNKEGDLEKAAAWFKQRFPDETDDLLMERIALWKSSASTLSAYKDGELLAVYITINEGEKTHYLGCFWNPLHKNRSLPTYLLAQDISDSISRGVRFYDLGVGDEPYKKRWKVIERKTKYFAVMTAHEAKIFDVKNYVALVEQVSR